ncbi:MAG: CpsD/CapB family tyrosine-protein kinase, partial [Nitrospira sp.]
GGGGLGVGLAIGLDRLNPTFRRREELELLSGVRVLATVPQFLTVPSEDTTELGNRFQTDLHSAIKSETGSDLVAKWRPRSLAADQYRMAATRIALSTERRRSTLIEVTSALEGEGKTTTVANLGYTIARDLEKKTLLLECDFRRPALQRYVKEPVPFGLLDLLDGVASVDECLVNFDEVPCSIMTLGRSREGLNELVRIDQVRKILPQLRAQFQYILLNTPPVLASASMGVLASLADEIVLVIRAGSSPKHVVQKAFAMLDLTGERQVVLNRVDEQSLPHYLYGYSMSYHEEPVLADVPK